MKLPDKKDKSDNSMLDKDTGSPDQDKLGNDGDEINPSPWSTGGSTKIRDDEKILLEVVQHPFRKKWYISVLVVLFILVLSALSYTIIPNPLMPVFVIIFFVVSMTSFFLPSRYTFTEEKVVIDRIIYRKAYPWTRFRSYRADKNGIYLSPVSDSDRFDRFRGVFMVMDRNSRDKVESVLEEYVGKIAGENEEGNR